jgi:murein DD-endopeptidase MepM/ murein hydrolase activator NlpD
VTTLTRASRRATAVLAGSVVLSVVTALAAPASTLERIEQRQQQLADELAGTQGSLAGTEARIGEAQQEVHESTKRLAEATKEFQEAQAALPGAQAALTRAEQELSAARSALAAAQARSAQAAGELAAAQAAEAAAVEELRLAEVAVVAAKKRVQRLGGKIETKQASIGQVAAQAYQRGALGDLESLSLVLGADSIEEFNARVTYVQSAINAEGVVVDQLQDDRAQQANARVALEEAEERARVARAAAADASARAATALADAQTYEAAAQQAASYASTQQAQAATAAEQVASLVGRRDQARAAAEKAKVSDVAAYQSLQSERSSIEAEVAALAAQVRAQEQAAQAERDRLEEERRRAEEAARRAEEERRAAEAADRSSGQTGSSRRQPAPAPAPAPAAPAPAPPSSFSGPLQRPVAGPITSTYGMRLHPVLGYWKLHDGTDYGAACGTPIYAAGSGTVAWATYRGGYGNQVLINHGWVNGAPLATSYSHMSAFSVRPGQRVSTGQRIGYVGTTGYSTGCHLHWMVYVDGATVNPQNYY